jgi:hypothetical protein
MKKLLLFLFLLSASLIGTAQSYNEHGIIIPPATLRSNFASVYEASGYLNNMRSLINWQENFQVRQQNGINNAYATIINNQRYIVYDNRFLESLDQYAGTKWASISVLAHEMGHHYYNHVVDGSGSSLPKELEADFFSGYMMAKMGASLEQAKAAMSQIASPRASASHPGKADRLTAIANGWNSASGATNGTVNKNPVPNSRPKQTQVPPGKQQTPVANDADWIHLSVAGNSNMNVYLSDDGRNFSQAQLKTNRPFVFKYEIYDYGWLRIGNGNNAKTYKLYHGRNYNIVQNRRGNWVVTEG